MTRSKITMTASHVDITVFARPNSRKESINLDSDGKTLVVSVSEQPERGKANKAILKHIAKWLGTTTSNITLIQGSASTTKKIRVDGINEAEFRAAVQKLH